MTGTNNQRASIGKLAFTAIQGFFDQIIDTQIGVHGVIGLRHEIPRRPVAECSKRFVVGSRALLPEKSGPDYARKPQKSRALPSVRRKSGVCQEIYLR